MEEEEEDSEDEEEESELESGRCVSKLLDFNN